MERRHLSYSQINQFLRICPLQYAFQRIMTFQPEFVTESLPFGSTIHRTAEHLWANRMDGKDVTEDDLAGLFAELWKREVADRENLQFQKGDFDSLLKQGQDMIRVYRRAFPDNCDIVAYNLPFQVPLIGGHDADIGIPQGTVHGQVHNCFPLEIVALCNGMKLRRLDRRRAGSVPFLPCFKDAQHREDSFPVEHLITFAVGSSKGGPNDPKPPVCVAAFETLLVDEFPESVPIGTEVFLGQSVQVGLQGDVAAEFLGDSSCTLEGQILSMLPQPVQVYVENIRHRVDDQRLVAGSLQCGH